MQLDLETEINNVIEQNSLKKINDTLYLTQYQTEILAKNHIPYQTCQSVKDILFLLNDLVDEEEIDELEEIASQLHEFSYYHEINK